MNDKRYRLWQKHSPTCSQGWRYRQYVLSEVTLLKVDKTLRPNPHAENCCAIFRCNDPSCQGQLIVLERTIQRAVGIPQRERPQKQKKVRP